MDIENDLDEANGFALDTDDSIVDALLKKADIKEDKKKPGAPLGHAEEVAEDPEIIEDDSEETEDGEEAEANETDEDADETDEDAGEEEGLLKSKKITIEPEADAWVKIGDKEVAVKDLAKLYGRDEDLTVKTAEAEGAKKALETNATRYTAGLEAMLQRAVERAEPYSKINFLALTKDPNVSVEELNALHTEAQRAFSDVEYLKTSLDGVVNEMHQARHTELVKQGQEAWKTLSDPEKGIKGWSEDKYKEVSSFAIASGIDKRVVDELVDPAAIKIIHMAMLYSKGAKAAVATKKVDKSPKKIIKGNTGGVAQKVRSESDKSAFEKLRRTGSIDDAADAFLSRMKISDD